MISDLAGSRLYAQLCDSYATANAPGTAGNRITQAKAYVAFMLKINCSVFYPQTLNVLLYVQLLKNSCKSIQSVKNYISGARTYISERGGNPEVFSHPMVVKLLKGFVRNSSHTPQQAAPINVDSLKKVCLWLRELSVEGEILAAALMFGFVTFLRQCHFCYTNTGYMHLILRDDITIHSDKAEVTVRSSKTSGPAAARVQTILATGGPICPVRLIAQAMNLVPAGGRSPVFLHPSTKMALDPHRALDLFRLALIATGHNGVEKFTLHSLRRSGPQACARAGVPIDQLAHHGNWRSKAVYTYVPREISLTTPKAVKELLSYKNGE